MLSQPLSCVPLLFLLALAFTFLFAGPLFMLKYLRRRQIKS